LDVSDFVFGTLAKWPMQQVRRESL